MGKNNMTQTIVTISLLIALEIIFTRFLSINLPIMRIGFGFLPIAMLGIMYGPLYAGIAYALGDVLGMLIFPPAAFFPGFTLTAFLTGLTYGLIFHKRKITWRRTLVAVVTVILLYSLILNSLWLSIMYGKGFIALLPTRLLQSCIMVPVQLITIKLVWDRVMSKLPAFKASAQ